MKKNIGLTALLLFALVVGLLPNTAYASAVTGVRKGYVYQTEGQYKGDFCIQFTCDDINPNTPSSFDKTKVIMNGQELTKRLAGAKLSGNTYITATRRIKYEENGNTYRDAYMLISKDAITEDAKITIELKGLAPMKYAVKGTAGNFTLEEENSTTPANPPAELEAKKAALVKVEEYLKGVDKLALAEVENDANRDRVKYYQHALEELEEWAHKKDAPETLTDEDLIFIKEYLGYENGKWDFAKGSLKKLVKQIVVDFEVQGTRTVTDKRSGKKYTTVAPKNGEIKIRTNVAGLSKDKNAAKRLYLNAVTKTEYEDSKYDATTGATPRYDKTKFDASKYDLSYENGIYTIKIKEIPEDIMLVKPVIKVMIAPESKAENGDLVFVKKTQTPGTTPSHPSKPSTPSVPSVTPSSDGMTKIPAQEGEAYGYALAPAGSVDANTRVRITEKANGKQDVILVDANGNQVYSNELMLVTIPAPKGQQGSYRVKVNGVYTTFELSEDGKYVTLPMVFSRDGKRTEDVIVTEGAVSVKGTKTALPGMYKLSVIDRGNARYSVNLLDQNGNQVHSSGPVMVTMPAPAGAGDVYRVKADGKWITFEVEDRTVRFALVF